VNRLASHRQRGRYRPRVEALEERCVLNASITGGQIVTTGSVNHVLITDDGTTIRVFADNSPYSPLATLAEGTSLTVSTEKAGSTNFISYEVKGDSLTAMYPVIGGPPIVKHLGNFPRITGTLDVNFGSGPGHLWAQVTTDLPNNVFGGYQFANLGYLGDSSNLQITTSGSGSTDVGFASRDIGQSATLRIVDNGGKGSNLLEMALLGVQYAGSMVSAWFSGGNGNDQANVTDDQDIQSGAAAAFVLDGKAGKDTIFLQYVGQLQGHLSAWATEGLQGGAGAPKADPATFSLLFDLQPGSSGSLTSFEVGGLGSDNLTDIVQKAAADAPQVVELADGGAGGFNTGTFTINTPTEVGVLFTRVQKVNVVNVP
jgi:hypothetical protein